MPTSIIPGTSILPTCPKAAPLPPGPGMNESDSYTLVGEIIEVTKPKIKFDEGFQMEVGTISGKAEFRQKVQFDRPGPIPLPARLNSRYATM